MPLNDAPGVVPQMDRGMAPFYPPGKGEPQTAAPRDDDEDGEYIAADFGMDNDPIVVTLWGAYNTHMGQL